MTNLLSKRYGLYYSAIALISLFFVATSNSLNAADPLDDIRAKFTAIPDKDDECWRDVPTAKIVEKLQFLVDQ